MIDLTHKTFGRLTVLSRARRGRRLYWRCRCSCGVVKKIRADSLHAEGGTRSCGCLQREAVSAIIAPHSRGQRFAKLVIIRQVGSIPKRGRLYRCMCDCGKRVTVEGRRLREGTVQSCGCHYRASRTTNIKHGQCRIARKTPTYSAYQRWKNQCRNPRGRMARYFYERGIKFLFDSFLAFYQEVGERPGLDFCLTRINPDGHIEPGNLEWHTIRRHAKRRGHKPRS